MMMPVYPGAPWVPKYKGLEADVSYGDWKEQIQGLLNAQEVAEARKVEILIGALSGEAKRQVSVLEEKDRDQIRKIFTYLDSLYGDNTSLAVLRSQFFSCIQKPNESVKSFTLRLRELYCRLQQRNPNQAPTEKCLQEQMLLGLREGPLSQTLRAYVRHHPEEDFATVHREALLLEEEQLGHQGLQTTCLAVAVGERPAEAVATWTEAEAGQMFPTDCQTAYINTTSAPCRDPQGLVPQMNDWKEAQEKDMDLRILREYVERGVPPDAPTRGSLPSPVQKLLHQWRRLQVCEGTLCREVRDPNTNEMYLQILCPAERHKEVWEKYHEAAAHAGVEKTLSRIRRFFYWPSMEEEVREFQLGCAACSLRDRNRPRAPLHPIIVSYPLEIVALDFLTLGRPTDRYQNILVMTDLFRRYAWAVPTKDQTAQTAVHALWAHVIQTFGCPTRLHSDRGGSFESALMYQLCKCYGITKSKTTPYHPAGNGGVERMNQTLLHMLRSLESERQQRWPEYLPELLQAYNNTVHSATGYAPSYLMFGRHLRQPVDLSLGVERESPCHDLGGWVKDHHQKLSFAYEMARKKMRAAATQNKRAYDRSARALPLVPGERVWIRDRNRQGQGKLHPGWSSEPYVVVEEVTGTVTDNRVHL
ncbi:uncharacterized protein LOC112842954 [Oreochromis niloticus]|uniref:uncharacterized protein LOC112842954 n=1 Tax=Oreochromis niloticus TaxID=8128 RepID=UPI000DF2F435|nr:uncharacterized protein LOC112842954 [Oreochromis niloticus]